MMSETFIVDSAECVEGVAREMRLALIEEVRQAGRYPDVREAVGGLVEQRRKVERVRAHEGQGRMR